VALAHSSGPEICRRLSRLRKVSDYMRVEVQQRDARYEVLCCALEGLLAQRRLKLLVGWRIARCSWCHSVNMLLLGAC
jgi:LSD1 subclass zinc finger protein